MPTNTCFLGMDLVYGLRSLAPRGARRLVAPFKRPRNQSPQMVRNVTVFFTALLAEPYLWLQM